MNRSESYILDATKDFNQEKERLCDQAKALFEIESKHFRDDVFEADIVIDLGCGNGTYLELLSEIDPRKRYLGIDRNEKLLQSKGVEGQLLHYDLLDVESWALEVSGKRPLFIMRFVMQHMNHGERRLLANKLAEKFPGGKLICIEISSDEFEAFPPDDNLERINSLTIEYQGKKGGDRCIGRKLNEELLQCCQTVTQETYSICTDNLGWDKFTQVFAPIWMAGLKLIEDEIEKNTLNNSVNAWFKRSSGEAQSFASFKFYCVKAKL